MGLSSVGLIKEDLVNRFGRRVSFGSSLAPLSTYRVGGPAAALVEVTRLDDLISLHQASAGLGIAHLVIGKGSNLLVSSNGFDGIVVRLAGEFNDVSYNEAAETMDVGGAVLLPVLARQASRIGRTGLEWMVGIPGSVGGAVRMNAGGHGNDMASCLVSALLYDLVDGQTRVAGPVDLEMKYRSSNTKSCEVVVSAELKTQLGEFDDSEKILKKIVKWRRENQPGGANAGSVFANPEGDSAGRLIEAAGGKGLRVGGATVSTKHANFILCEPDASPEDVYGLIALVRNLVQDRHGVFLRTENLLIGFE